MFIKKFSNYIAISLLTLLMVLFNNCTTDFNPDVFPEQLKEASQIENIGTPEADTDNNFKNNIGEERVEAEFDYSNFPSTGYGAEVYFSYRSDLSGSNLLHKSEVRPSTIFIYLKNINRFKQIEIYCCKGVNDSGVPRKQAVTEVHHDMNLYSVIKAPHRFYKIDAHQLRNDLIYEVYFDAILEDGTIIQNNYVHFQVK